MDAKATSNTSICVIDPSSYSINGSINGVSLDKDGSFTVDASRIIALTTFSVSVVAGT